MRWKIAALAAAASGLVAGAEVASAATVYASVVDSFNQGLRKNGSAVTAARSDPNAALGSPDGSFVSLGFGGTLVVRFDPFQFGPPSAAVIETTNNPNSYPVESAEVSISADGVNWTVIGTVTNASNSVPVSGGPWTYLRLIDKSAISGPLSAFESTADGFDVNSIAVNAVPVPAAIWAGSALLGGLIVARRRQSSAAI